jgi:hypothetical protein
MAKSRKKARKAAKRTARKRKPAVKARSRKPVKKTRRAKRRKQASIVDTVAGTVRETGELRSRLAGTNTFED